MAKKSPDLLQTLADYFDDYLPIAKGLSANTITSYQYAFSLLFEFLYEVKKLPPEKVTFKYLCGDTITEYLNWLESSRGCSAKTRNLRRAAISSFAKYAMKKNFTEGLSFFSDVKNTPKKKVPKNQEIKYFTKEEMEILLSLPDTSTNIGYRDAALLSLLYASGTRAQEICDLTANDIRFGKETSIHVVGKGTKARNVIIPENCAKLLKKYMLSVNLPYPGDASTRRRHVFSSQTREHMTISCVEEIVKKYVAKAKTQYPQLFIKKSYSPHCFRHSIAVHMLESGVPMPVIKAFLGHSSILTTMEYASVTSELANKYLTGRNSIIDSVELNAPTVISPSLHFLNKYRGRTTE